MSNLMLEAVLRMPVDLWGDDIIDKVQRHSRYIQAADELFALKATINKVWADTYPGSVDTQDLSALQCRIKNLAEDRNCWLFNAKVANNKLNELEGKR